MFLNKKTKILGLVGMISAAALLAGCSSGGSKDALDRVESSGTLRVGIEGAYPPFNSFDSSNELVGFDVDISNAIAGRLDAKAEFVPTPWDSIIGGLNAGKYEIVISSLTITDERAQKVDFSDPYYHTGTQVFAPEGNTIASTDDLAGLNIGVTLGTTFEDMALERGAQVTTYKSDQLAMEDLSNGRIDGVITDGPVGLAIVSARGYNIVTVGDRISNPAAGIAVDKNQENLLKAVNDALADMQQDGTYEEISTKWFGADIR
ncbi:transporter substrate-binding domain-containing protein [Leucobacter aridicollis]|uniref:transporter substrate-binding domain-containing protein n=1 Tax=Leucobacter aridicollis TaxID=283878 RepID=UPI000E64CB35|nr:transporter substrate-binding domain-containing protein [Leucobacter aridicollis]UTX52110.1 transporter substrate-binding domain-containing protein [Leucobacter aridicollis]